MKISDSKLPNVGTTIFTTMSALASTHNALNLSQGFPDFESDPDLIQLVNKAMRDGFNQYAPMAGLLELRMAIANKIESLYQYSYNPENEIIVTAGATQAIFTIISAFIEKDDEVIIFDPAYDCYAPSVELNKGKIVPIQLLAPDFKIDWDLVRNNINEKTKMLVINSPHNPGGSILQQKDMVQLQNILTDTNIILLSDEVYEHIIFDGEQHQSACLFEGLRRRALIVASFGKTFHNTGWKIGYCCGPQQLMNEIKKVHQFNVFCVNHPVQKALAEYINNPNNYLNLPVFYQRKRDLFLNLISKSRFKFKPAKGTYFQSLDYSEITDEADVAYAKRLTIEEGIASIPLSVFNSSKLDQKVLRFCFAKSEQTLIKAADILLKI